MSITGEISFRHDDLRDGDLEIVSSRIEEILETASTKGIVRQGNSIEFKPGLFTYIGNWGPLRSVTSGMMAVESGLSSITIRYVLSMVHLVVLATIMIGVMGAIIAFNPSNDTPPPATLILFLPIGWLWLIGGNYLLTKFRFSRWLERALREKKLFEHG